MSDTQSTVPARGLNLHLSTQETPPILLCHRGNSSFNINYLLKGLASKQCLQGFGLQRRNFGRARFSPFYNPTHNAQGSNFSTPRPTLVLCHHAPYPSPIPQSSFPHPFFGSNHLNGYGVWPCTWDLGSRSWVEQPPFYTDCFVLLTSSIAPIHQALQVGNRERREKTDTSKRMI